MKCKSQFRCKRSDPDNLEDADRSIELQLSGRSLRTVSTWPQIPLHSCASSSPLPSFAASLSPLSLARPGRIRQENLEPQVISGDPDPPSAAVLILQTGHRGDQI